jgi:acetyl-CoA carboxylase biotin carboxyl carrier protein
VASSIRAHIAGTVWRIDVAAGDEVNVGQPVVVLESMKMEMVVEAPAAGRVNAVRVACGQFVEEGSPLVELE